MENRCWDDQFHRTKRKRQCVIVELERVTSGCPVDLPLGPGYIVEILTDTADNPQEEIGGIFIRITYPEKSRRAACICSALTRSHPLPPLRLLISPFHPRAWPDEMKQRTLGRRIKNDVKIVFVSRLKRARAHVQEISRTGWKFEIFYFRKNGPVGPLEKLSRRLPVVSCTSRPPSQDVLLRASENTDRIVFQSNYWFQFHFWFQLNCWFQSNYQFSPNYWFQSNY